MTIRLPAWLQGGSYSAEIDRFVSTGLLVPASALGARGGVRHYDGNDFKVTATSPATMQVNINAGMAWVPGKLAVTQGAYAVVNDATLTLAVPAPDPSRARIDLVILEVLDQVYSGTLNIGQLRVVTGTPSSLPVVPTVAGNYIVLAQLSVAANASSISGTAITDLRSFAAALGSPTPVISAAARLALTSVPTGMSVYEIDTTRVYQWTGTSWSYQWGGVPPTVAITLSNGWYNWTATHGGTIASIRGTKINSFVDISGVIGNANAMTGGSTMFFLPTGWAPERDILMGVRTDSSAEEVRLDVRLSGQVLANGFQSVSIPANTSWFVNFRFNTRNNTVG